MRIGVQANTFSGRRTGINNYCYSMISALAENHPEVEFVNAHLFGWNKLAVSEIASQSEAEPSSIGIGPQSLVKRLKKNETARRLYGRAQEISLSRAYRSRDISLFHAFNYVPPIEPAAPTLPVVYDLSFIRYPQMHPAERLNRLSSLATYIERASLIHTISEFSKREIIDVYRVAAERVFVAYPAAAAHFKPLGHDVTSNDLRRLGLRPDGYLLAVGTLEPRKNLRTLIAAFAQLPAADRIQFPLVIVGGDGWGETNFPEATEVLLREGSLRFTGFISDATLRSLYEGARLMAYPSIYEGFGMPVVEAMACGAPVAHSSNTSMDEITSGITEAVPALEVEAWTSCLSGAISRYPTAEYRTSLIARAAKFDWKVGAEQIYSAYLQISRA